MNARSNSNNLQSHNDSFFLEKYLAAAHTDTWKEKNLIFHSWAQGWLSIFGSFFPLGSLFWDSIQKFTRQKLYSEIFWLKKIKFILIESKSLFQFFHPRHQSKSLNGSIGDTKSSSDTIAVKMNCVASKFDTNDKSIWFLRYKRFQTSSILAIHFSVSAVREIFVSMFLISR